MNVIRLEQLKEIRREIQNRDIRRLCLPKKINFLEKILGRKNINFLKKLFSCLNIFREVFFHSNKFLRENLAVKTIFIIKKIFHLRKIFIKQVFCIRSLLGRKLFI